MRRTHKTAEESTIETQLKDLRILPDHILGRIDEFKVDFKKNGEIGATRGYNNVGVVVVSEREGKLLDRREVLKEVQANLVFGANLEDDVGILKNLKVTVEFDFEGKKHLITGAAMHPTGPIVILEKEGDFYLSERFLKRLHNDLRSVQRKLEWVLQFDTRLTPAFKMDSHKTDERDKLINELADEAERISERLDIENNPLSLLPVLNKARDKGVVAAVIIELSLRRGQADDPGKIGRLVDTLIKLKNKQERELGKGQRST